MQTKRFLRQIVESLVAGVHFVWGILVNWGKAVVRISPRHAHNGSLRETFERLRKHVEDGTEPTAQPANYSLTLMFLTALAQRIERLRLNMLDSASTAGNPVVGCPLPERPDVWGNLDGTSHALFQTCLRQLRSSAELFLVAWDGSQKGAHLAVTIGGRKFEIFGVPRYHTVRENTAAAGERARYRFGRFVRFAGRMEAPEESAQSTAGKRAFESQGLIILWRSDANSKVFYPPNRVVFWLKAKVRMLEGAGHLRKPEGEPSPVQEALPWELTEDPIADGESGWSRILPEVVKEARQLGCRVYCLDWLAPPDAALCSTSVDGLPIFFAGEANLEAGPVSLHEDMLAPHHGYYVELQQREWKSAAPDEPEACPSVSETEGEASATAVLAPPSAPPDVWHQTLIFLWTL